jgi:adenine specific DNA methylase Mod
VTISAVPRLQPITRWTIIRKGELLNMIIRKQVSEEEVLNFYKDLSPEELRRWRELFFESGHTGLKATRSRKERRKAVLKAA